MFFPEDRVRVWLYARPTDMRKQFDGLAALARNQLREDPMDGISWTGAWGLLGLGFGV
jgi:transposase